MKKILCSLLCVGLLFGCGSSGSDNTSESTTETTTEKSDYELVSEKFTISTDKTDNGSSTVKAKDSNGNEFVLYLDFQGDDATLANTLKIEEKSLAFSINDEQDIYIVDSNLLLISVNDETAESLSQKMNDLLEEDGLTVDQVKQALLDESNK